MASPKYEVFALFDASGNPFTGATPTFLTYKDSTGVDVAQPSIVEVGGGLYRFLPVFADPTLGLVYVVDGGASANHQKYWRYMRNEDWYPDLLLDLEDEILGQWKLFPSGPDANRLVLYRQDGTVLKKFDLKDSAGNPTSTQPFSRVPV